MANNDYWVKRAEEKVLSAEQMALDYEKRMQAKYREAVKALDAEITRIYNKYARDNQMRYADALDYLTVNDRKEFQRDLEYYIETASDPNLRFVHKQELQALSVRARVKRIEAMQAAIKMEAEKLFNALESGSVEMYGKVYDDAYYRTAHQVFSQLGVGNSFAQPSAAAIKKLLEYPWNGKSYSANVWDLERGFVDGLNRVLTTGLIRGQSVQEMSRALRDAALGKEGKKGGELYRAQRLIRTETNFILNQASKDMYEEAEVEEYEFLGTLDSRTCEHCGGLDGKHYPVKDEKPGVNYPPLHPLCRCTTISYFSDLGGERVARAADGSSYTVPGDMSYEEWRGGLAEEENTKKRGHIATHHLGEFDPDRIKLADQIMEDCGCDEEKALQLTADFEDYFDREFEEIRLKKNAYYAAKSDRIDQYLKASPKFDAAISRGIRLDTQGIADLKQARTNKHLIDMQGGISSWTSRDDVSIEFAGRESSKIPVIFRLVETRKGASVAHLSKYGLTESEVLMPSTAKFRVLAINQIKNVELVEEKKLVSSGEKRYNKEYEDFMSSMTAKYGEQGMWSKMDSSEWDIYDKVDATKKVISGGEEYETVIREVEKAPPYYEIDLEEV